MSLLEDIWSTPPAATNAEGGKFWLDKDLTRYAREKGLKNVTVLFAEAPNGHRARIVTEGGQPVYEHTGYEDIACHIDIMALAQTWDEDETRSTGQ